jgi:SAM-dependent methyltransferase
VKRAAHYQTLEYERVSALLADLASNRATRLRVLDYGCGQGRYLDCFASLGFAVTGVDTNAHYVAEARVKGHEAYGCDEFFGVATGLFDVVFLSHVIEHLAPGPLIELISRLCALLASDGRLVIVTPTPGDRFFHDFSHVRPYLPQSIRHAFGQTGAPISFGQKGLIELTDIYFFRDPYRTRLWRTFYVATGIRRSLVRAVNASFDALWRVSGGRIGVTASWLGVYKLIEQVRTRLD